jgi:adenylate kinase
MKLDIILSMNDLILIAMPGAGKGTQARVLAAHGYTQLSTGDLLRAEVKKQTKLGKEIDAIIKHGNLVNDQMALELIKANFQENESYIFDGFPRTLTQAKMLTDQVLGKRNFKVIYLKINEETLVSRLTARRTCGKCGNIYNLVSVPPKNEGKCDDCNIELTHRSDDKAEVIETRLNVFKSTVGPILDYYKQIGCLVEINADQAPNRITDELLTVVQS